MKNKAILIGGVLAILGAGAYMFFKNKKKTQSGSESLTPISPATSVMPTISEATALPVGTIVTSTTTSSNAEEQAKLDSAKNIEVKIKSYYQKGSLRSKTNERLFKTSGIGGNPYPLLINNLKKELALLGYEYKGGADGFLIKI
jgi:hypothetical protein